MAITDGSLVRAYTELGLGIQGQALRPLGFEDRFVLGEDGVLPVD